MKQIDPTLLRNTLEVVRAGDTVWDIGANVGLFTYAAAAQVGPAGKVFAIEADTWLVGLLRRSLQIQPPTSGQVTVIPAAVGADVELGSLRIGKRSRASNAMQGYGQSQMGGTAEIQTVVTLSLDWLSERLPSPNVIKCDVEGAEGEVFANSVDFLKRKRPVVICEVAEGTRTIAEVFRTADYVFFDGHRPLRGSSPASEPSWATIAIPSEVQSLYCGSSSAV